MKTSARFLAMLLAVVMIASAALSVSAFSDVTGAVEHATAINVLAQLGVIGGYEDNTFKPEQNITRAEMAKLVYVLYTTFVDAGEGTVKFDDVEAGKWYTGYISWCASKGIIGGYGNGKFGPNDNVKYNEALKMVAGTLGYNEWNPSEWPTDVRMKALNELKLGKDIPETVAGTDELTRAQVAQIMYNALEAKMNETKVVDRVFVDGAGNEFPIPTTVSKTLAEDVWKFEKVEYTVIATEKLGDKKTDKGDSIVLGWEVDKTDKDGNIVKDDNGKVVKESKDEKFKLTDIGLEAYENKTNDLYGLKLIGLEKDGKRLGNPSIIGTIKDGITLSYATARKELTIDGNKYDEDDFAADAKYPITITVNGNTVKVFDKGELTTDLTNNILPNKQYLARAIDFDGNGFIDKVEIVEKAAYKVLGTGSDKDGKYVKLETLAEGVTAPKIYVDDLSIAVAKDDIIVVAILGDTAYATKVEPVTTYATKLNKGDGKVTLNEIGEVKFDKLTIAKVDAAKMSASDLGSDNEDVYYIYNGEVIKKANARTDAAYSFAILRDIEAGKPEVQNQVFTTAYYANLLVVEEGKLVLKKLPIDPKVGESLIGTYEVKQKEVDGKKLADYNYELVVSYEENKDKYYDIKLAKDLTSVSEEYVLVPAAANITFSEDTGLYTVGAEGKVRVNDNTLFFYNETEDEGISKGFVDLKFYTNKTITDRTFGDDPAKAVVTKSASLLQKDDKGRLTLLATFVAAPIEGSATDAVVSYRNDGSLILFAPESSSIEIQDGKQYNSYVFMDNATLTVKEPVLDTNKEYGVDNAGTTGGRLYGYNAKDGKYDEVTASLGLKSIQAETLLDVLVDDELIEFTNKNQLIKVGADVTIWGLAEKDKFDKYTQLTFAELGEMFELVEGYNDNLAEDAEKETIEMLMLYKVETVEGKEKKTLQSIIVEIYEADKDDDTVVYSVNDDIIEAFKK